MSGEDSGVDGVGSGSDSDDSACMSIESSQSGHNEQQLDEQIGVGEALASVAHHRSLPDLNQVKPDDSVLSSFVNSGASSSSSESGHSRSQSHSSNSLPLSTNSVPFGGAEYIPPQHAFLPLPMIQFQAIPIQNDLMNVDNDNGQHDYCPKMRVKLSKKHDKRWKPIASFKDLHGEKSLLKAVSENDVDTLKKLLEEGVDPSSCDDKKRSALHIAVSKRNIQTVRLLIEQGANPNQKDKNGTSPLHLAACSHDFEVITLLLKSGADITSLDNSGFTPIGLAQSKLRLIQHQFNQSLSSTQLKEEVLQIIEMMVVYLKRSGKLAEVDLLSSFSSRINAHEAKEEMDCDLKDLMSSLIQLSL